MEIEVNEERKSVLIWLSRAEKQDAALRETLKPLYQQYREKQYLVAVFESGEQSLESLTSDLLCYNRKQLAQLEVQKEKEAGMTMSM